MGNQNNNRIASPASALLRIQITLDLNTGDTKLQCNQPISATKLISIFAQTIKANADAMIAIEAGLVQGKPGLQIAPHDFNGDEAGVCTVCGKLENAHGTVVQ